ncbi:MAG: hypothetical protein AVDCRST_MAG67-2436, partial [uncultured Solirubrobacteraceae bacterium]
CGAVRPRRSSGTTTPDTRVRADYARCPRSRRRSAGVDSVSRKSRRGEPRGERA